MTAKVLPESTNVSLGRILPQSSLSQASNCWQTDKVKQIRVGYLKSESFLNSNCMSSGELGPGGNVGQASKASRSRANVIHTPCQPSKTLIGWLT